MVAWPRGCINKGQNAICLVIIMHHFSRPNPARGKHPDRRRAGAIMIAELKRHQQTVKKGKRSFAKNVSSEIGFPSKTQKWGVLFCPVPSDKTGVVINENELAGSIQFGESAHSAPGIIDVERYFPLRALTENPKQTTKKREKRVLRTTNPAHRSLVA